jgi:hypothetical protein
LAIAVEAIATYGIVGAAVEAGAHDFGELARAHRGASLEDAVETVGGITIEPLGAHIAFISRAASQLITWLAEQQHRLKLRRCQIGVGICRTDSVETLVGLFTRKTLVGNQLEANAKLGRLAVAHVRGLTHVHHLCGTGRGSPFLAEAGGRLR